LSFFSGVESQLNRKAETKMGEIEIEPGKEEAQKPTLNPKPSERRNSLFAYLGHAIRLSNEKMCSKGNSDSAKQSWGRLMVSAISAYGGLIKDAEMDDVESRLTKLEEQKAKEKELSKRQV
jgi:hypothetical protein